MKRIIILAFALSTALLAMAQPQKSRVATNRAKTEAQQSVSRASLMYPTAVAVPADVPWRREIYREISLMDNQNAALYYPLEARGNEANLFTVLFRLLNTGTIPAYKYDINSSAENLTEANRMHFKDMLDSYEIPYEIDGRSIKVLDYDIPSAEVLSYYVKESSYYDEVTATYHTRVVAFCPVLHRNDEFSLEESSARKYPLFWVRMEDVEPYLSQHMIMVSNLNNASRMSMADFFATNHYKGNIYMTTNMQGRSLQQMYPDETARKNEQKRIEKQIVDFEKHLWATPVDSAELARLDSIAAVEDSLRANRKRSVRTTRTTRTSASSARSTVSTQKAEKQPKASSSASSGPRVTVRRQRH